MDTGQTSRKALANKGALRFILAIPVFLAIFFLPAGTWAYWQAWVYMAVLLIPMLASMLYLLKNDPELAASRMRMKEKEQTQSALIKFTSVFFMLVFILPGFDVRWGWSNVPGWVSILADVLVLAGIGVTLLVLRENRYASRVIEIQKGQKVISSGPYAVVRHPMYVGIGLMILASPVALGSYWAFLPALLVIPTLAARIVNEEQVLLRDLPGYREYTQKTRFRLIPGIW